MCTHAAHISGYCESLADPAVVDLLRELFELVLLGKGGEMKNITRTLSSSSKSLAAPCGACCCLQHEGRCIMEASTHSSSLPPSRTQGCIGLFGWVTCLPPRQHSNHGAFSSKAFGNSSSCSAQADPRQLPCCYMSTGHGAQQLVHAVPQQSRIS